MWFETTHPSKCKEITVLSSHDNEGPVKLFPPRSPGQFSLLGCYRGCGVNPLQFSSWETTNKTFLVLGKVAALFFFYLTHCNMCWTLLPDRQPASNLFLSSAPVQHHFSAFFCRLLSLIQTQCKHKRVVIPNQGCLFPRGYFCCMWRNCRVTQLVKKLINKLIKKTPKNILILSQPKWLIF